MRIVVVEDEAPIREGMAKLLGYADDLVSSGKYEKKEMQDHPFSSRAAIA